ncbi:hypothetical protein A7P98_04870 [Eikenella sp. NML080894]|uniref:Isoprenylcysteine carboxylmethyltransferase family protein n=1 Tax=Eikenella exigua TaxID=2528037 RepID=A0AAX1F4Y4_9NEIS|nr:MULTISPECIES: isoprenylcysteine carboxylmethyltransferase family protein [Eikenella]OAM26255.1 hypothetical protein A7P94_08100 [Eikenella sp. NML01-A-086]OAM36323.1 hypothetical protein A7P98_04870 [Eikenella sp. NML080894]OAM38272.1 hypothetical protein A7P99_03665 [Eikenella sp. NML120348]OAM41889.1 hypothetical protein A7Q02_04120 [Eikenella sp. NML97-A-109]OAM45128.1 hypothetical protein A7Q03_06325 [Eikenella sp. NML99-0057]
MGISFFTTLEPSLVGAWIPSFAMVLIQFVYMFIYKEVGRRATDTSWYGAEDRRNAIISTLLQVVLLILSVFVPLKAGTVWFWIGSVIYVAAFAGFIKAFYDYAAASVDKAAQGGIYRLSRNPMYLFFFLGMAGVCIASVSLWLLIVLVPFVLYNHLLVLSEERYCEQIYGQEYLEYKHKTPRYFLFK